MKTKKPSLSTILQNDFLFEQSREREILLRRYKNKEAILGQLREMPVHARTYEFLGELFFNAAARELENDPPTEEWLRNLTEIRSEVYLLFELAKAAKVLGAGVPGGQGRPGRRSRLKRSEHREKAGAG